jgi:pyruvate/2-oxoglutarate dehydrogenase complex dihydrolipoamide acyltransferase (E2) component
VPVIGNADQLSLNELAQQSRQLADKAQNKKLFPLDYEGGTFTVSNLGMLGVDSFIAIINPPQCAILAVGRVAPRVVADLGAASISLYAIAVAIVIGATSLYRELPASDQAILGKPQNLIPHGQDRYPKP